MFDLEKAVNAWRHALRRRPVFLTEDLDELECHLRDAFADRLAAGQAPSDAFRQAMTSLGDFTGAEDEYRKVFWGKIRRRQRVLLELHAQLAMLHNYLAVAWRNIRRRGGLAFINVFGLGVAFACGLLIFLFVRNESAVNTVFPDVDRIYRVDSEWSDPAMGLAFTSMAPVGETLVREYPEVESAVRMYLMTSGIRVDDRSFREDVMVADPSVLDLFGITLLAGDPVTALDAPRSVIITDRLAETLFGTSDVLGRSLVFETWNQGNQPYTITGVRPSLPWNSVINSYSGHGGYDLITSARPFADYLGDESGWTSWDSRFILQYVRLAPSASIEGLNEKLGAFTRTFAPAEYADIVRIRLNPLSDLYLTDNGGFGLRVLRLIAAIALLLMGIAGINFMNLSTARALSRSREIGVRKTVGATRAQLAAQLLGESLLVCALGAGVGLVLAGVSLQAVFAFAGKHIVLPHLWDGKTLIALAGAVLVTGVAAGLYPALLLSGFGPVRALKGTARLGPVATRLRYPLVVLQFAVAIVLLISVVTISRQLSYVAGMDLGFRKDNVLVLNSVPRTFGADGVAQMMAFKQRLTRIPGVENASLSWRTAAEGDDSRALHPPSWNPDDAVSMFVARVDTGFLDTYGLTLVEGRFFSPDHPADSAGLVINERAAEAFGWHDGIEGKELVMWFGATAGQTPPPPRPVIGVVRDHHFSSLHTPIGPLAFVSLSAEPMYRVLGLRLSGVDVQQTVRSVEAAWEEAFPGAPFEFTFLDDQVDLLYRSEQQVQTIVGIAAALAILIACLGMLGMAAVNVQQRLKEVGIRKALGASVGHIVWLLSRDFTRPVLAAVALAIPLAFLLMRGWLADFAYRISLDPLPFAASAAAGLCIAWLTVAYHTVRAARTNPVETLRNE